MERKTNTEEGFLILGTVILLLALTLLALGKILPSSFQEITGNVITTVNVTAALPSECNFTLYAGYNLASFFCITTSEPLLSVVGNISSLQAMFEYQESGDDAWKVYNPALPSYVIQDLHFVSRLKGYWIIVSSDSNVYVNGSLRVPTYITLYPGWNLVGYPNNINKQINESFSNILYNITSVRAYDVVGGNMIGYVPFIGGALNHTEPYLGYWVNATKEIVWVVS